MFEKEIISMLKKETKLDNINLEIPPNPELGDYAFPCFSLSKTMKKDPKKIAEELAGKLKKTKDIKEIRNVGPYVNFFIDKGKLAGNVIDEVLKEKDKFGSSNVGRSKRALIEHTSINPNSAAHVGGARNAIIGDSLVRIFKFQGYNVETHFFVNDVGKQIAMLVYACKGKNPSLDDLLKEYIEVNKEIKKNPKIEKEILELLYKLENGDKKIKGEFKKIVDICMKGQAKLFKEIGIEYDYFDHESKYLWDGSTQKILDNLLKKDICFKDAEGRIVLNQEELANEMKSPYFVLTRGDGTSLYALRDLAYNIEKIGRAKKNVVVLGEEHKLYFKQVKLALKELGYEAPEVVFYSLVSLAEGKMSTRRGNIVMLEDFEKKALEKAEHEIKERKIKLDKDLPKVVGYGALKYSFLKISNDKNVLFDWKSALSFDGDSCPYIQYTHARASSILKKSEIKLSNIDYSLLKEKEEIELIKKMGEFEKVCFDAYEKLKPNLIANYVYELAKLFNEFYHKYPVLKTDEDLMKARLGLVMAVRQVIKNSLGLLGIESPERM